MARGMAMKAARTMVADMFRCTVCGKPKVEIATDWSGRGNGRSSESVHRATRFGGEVCECAPQVIEGAVVGTIELAPRTHAVPRTEYSNCWRCRSCGAGVDWRISTCLLCGYTREKCTTCDGTGTIDSGPHPVGCEEPCWCGTDLPTCEVGYYYPPVEVAAAPVEDVNDCAGCGDRPAVRDEDGNFTYPRYTHQARPPVGVCGWCEREGIRV